jgi:PIN domain nuclease of toxin-antitoxin system
VKKILLDTHTFLWWVDDSPKLSGKAKKIIADIDNSCLLSLVSCWEMAIKTSIGKLKLAIPVKEYIPRHMAANDFSMLPISFRHVIGVEAMPLHHRDPFDRLLAAQTLAEKMILVSADPAFDSYGVERIW